MSVYPKNVTGMMERAMAVEARKSFLDSYITLDRRLGGFWTCIVCKYKSRSRSDVRRHIETKHGDKEDVPCPHCNRPYKNKRSLKTHLRKGCKAIVMCS